MKLGMLMLWLVALILAVSARAQSTPSRNPVSVPSVGPGMTLPDHSTPSAVSDPGILFTNAKEFAASLQNQTMDFIGLLWLVSLLYAAWMVQIRGPQELIEPFLRVMISLVLLENYTDLATALMDSIKQLGNSLPLVARGAATGISSVALGGGLAAVLMTGSVSAIAAIAGMVVAVLLMAVAWLMQVLIKSFLIATGPLAIACLTFRHTAGIFTAWLKTFIALCLVPLGWKLGASLAVALTSLNFSQANGFGGIAGKTAMALGSALLIVPMAVSVFLGMPVITLWIVNKTSGVGGATFPSPIQQAAGWLGSVAFFRSAESGGARAVQVTGQVTTIDERHASDAPMGSESLYSKTLGGGSPVSPAMFQRTLSANHIHQQHQPKS